MRIERVTNTHKDFAGLIRELDTELYNRYDSQQYAYNQHNLIDSLSNAIIGYVDEKPVACGCFKVIDHQTIEIKRMFVANEFRRKGLSIMVLKALEEWSTELGYNIAILETGKRQPEAIGLYQKCGYEITDNYGPYMGLENSVCMKKIISSDEII